MGKFTLSSGGNKRTVSTNLSVTTSSASYDLAQIGVSGNTIRLANSGSTGLFYAIDDEAVTATTNDIYLPPNSVEYVNVQVGLNTNSVRVGYICAVGSTSLNITIGNEV